LEWVGAEWDGTSDIQVGSQVLPGAKADLLIKELRRLLAQSQIDGIVLPSAGSVRQNLSAINARQCLSIDFDFGDLALPLCVKEGMLGHPPFDDMTAVAVRMVEILFQTRSQRPRILQRELRLRLALEETVARIGHGAAPLWLRMDPVAIDDDLKHLATSPYLMLLLRLNDCLEWSPTGSERICTVKEIRDYHGYEGRGHRRRAKTLTRMTAAGSRGWISEVALSLIQERGLDPREVFEQVRSARLANELGAVEFVRNGTAERLFYIDGAVQASIKFDGGHYHAGQLTLWGNYPETLAISARGKPLTSFVDHPAFRATGVKVLSAALRREAVDLKHRVRMVPVEASRSRPIPTSVRPTPRHSKSRSLPLRRADRR
jgi:hypothetical protein